MTDVFDAHAFHPSLPKGKSSGKVTIDNQSIRFEGGGKQCAFLFSCTQISLGGASNRLVYFHDETQKDWVLYSADRNILKHPEIKAHPELTKQASKARGKRQGSWAVLITVALLVLLSPVAAYFSMPILSKLAAHQVPAEWEETLGKAAFAQYSVDYDLMDDDDTALILSPLSDPLLKALPKAEFDYRIHIANEESINAFALPGGYIVIHSGLILAADTPEEMLGVLAHEISHVTQKHSLQNIISSLGVYITLTVLLGDASGLVAIIGSAAPLLINQSFSRDFERNADEEGYKLLQKAKINPAGLRDFFKTMQAEEEKRLDKMSNDESREVIETAFQILSTHPSTDERIANIQAMLDNGDALNYLNLNNDFIKLQDAVKTFVVDNGGGIETDKAKNSETTQATE